MTLLPTIWMAFAELPRIARIFAIADTVAAHDDIRGPKHADPVAILPRPTGAVGDVLHPVVEHHRAVIARGALPDLDAKVAGATNGVARDRQPRPSRENSAASPLSRRVLPLTSPSTLVR